MGEGFWIVSSFFGEKICQHITLNPKFWSTPPGVNLKIASASQPIANMAATTEPAETPDR